MTLVDTSAGIAHRIAATIEPTAATGTKDYGLLTIFTALEATVTRQLTLPPGAFHPPPQVTSAVVRLTFLPADSRPDVPAAFESMVRALFAMRRKTILNGLKGPASAAGRSPADVIAQAGLDPRRIALVFLVAVFIDDLIRAQPLDLILQRMRHRFDGRGVGCIELFDEAHDLRQEPGRKLESPLASGPDDPRA